MDVFHMPRKPAVVRTLFDIVGRQILQSSFFDYDVPMFDLPASLARKLVQGCFAWKDINGQSRKMAFASLLSHWPRTVFSFPDMGIEDFDASDVRVISDLIKQGRIGRIELLDLSRDYAYHADPYHHQLNYGTRELLDLRTSMRRSDATQLSLVADLAITLEAFEDGVPDLVGDFRGWEAASKVRVDLKPRTIKYAFHLENLAQLLSPFVDCLKGLVIAVHNRVELWGTKFTEAGLECLASLSQLEYLHLEDYNMFPLETVLQNIRSAHVVRLDLFTSRLIKDALRAVVGNPVFGNLQQLALSYNEGWKLEETRVLFARVLLMNKATLKHVSIVGIPLSFVEDMVASFMELRHLEVLAICQTRSSMPAHILSLFEGHPSLKRFWLDDCTVDDPVINSYDLMAF